jgi:hypothetical protein
VLAQSAPFCPAGQPAQFVLGLGQLKQRLGARMGDPVECQHSDPAGGDLLQHTTTGLAYVRSSTGAPTFANGWEHYALTGDQLVLWRNSAVDPPAATPEQAAFTQDTFDLRGRVDQLGQRLTAIEQQGRAGALDDVDLTELGGIVDELTGLRDQFTGTTSPPSLTAYAQRWEQVQDADLAAAAALVQARLTADPAERLANLDEARTQLTARDQDREAATFAFSQVLPITVSP